MLTSTAYTHEVNILERREDTWARLLIGLQCAFSTDIASSRIYEISGCKLMDLSTINILNLGLKTRFITLPFF